MSTATEPQPLRTTSRFQNFAEVMEAVGNVPGYRLRVSPAAGLATEDDLLAIHAKEGKICELIDGILVEKDMASFESAVAIVLAFYIKLFQRETKQKLGVVLGEAGFLRLLPGRVFAPDVSFISWKKMPGGKFPKAPIASLVPDLAVEVLSKGNTEEEIKLKVRAYFQAGSRLVWVVDPKTRTVRVHTSLRKSVLLTEDQSVEGGKVLPGFALSIREWFVEAESGGEA